MRRLAANFLNYVILQPILTKIFLLKEKMIRKRGNTMNNKIVVHQQSISLKTSWRGQS